MPRHEGQNAVQAAWGNNDIRIDQGDIPPRAPSDPNIVGLRKTLIRAIPNQRDLRELTFHRVGRTIRRSVVDDDDFRVAGGRSLDYRSQAAQKRLSTVPIDDDDRKIGLGSHVRGELATWATPNDLENEEWASERLSFLALTDSLA